jgi:glutaredoxin
MEVVLLTQQDCSYCDQAKVLLDRLSAEYAFSVATIELDTPEGQQLAESGEVMFPPGIFISGEPFSYGRPSERKLHRELDRRIGLIGDR